MTSPLPEYLSSRTFLQCTYSLFLPYSLILRSFLENLNAMHLSCMASREFRRSKSRDSGVWIPDSSVVSPLTDIPGIIFEFLSAVSYCGSQAIRQSIKLCESDNQVQWMKMTLPLHHIWEMSLIFKWILSIVLFTSMWSVFNLRSLTFDNITHPLMHLKQFSSHSVILKARVAQDFTAGNTMQKCQLPSTWKQSKRNVNYAIERCLYRSST